MKTLPEVSRPPLTTPVIDVPSRILATTGRKRWLAVGMALTVAACSGSIDSARPGASSDNGPPTDHGPGNDAPGGKGSPGGTGGKGGGGTGGTAVDPPGSASESAGPLPLRRLTRREYNNTIAALFGDTSNQANIFPSDALDETGFASPQAVSTLEAKDYKTAAEAIASVAVKDLTRLLPCTPTGDEAGCARKFIQQFGRRVYRQPLAAAEVTDLFAIYDGVRTLGLDFPTGVQFVLQAMLQSPKFLYRWEVAPGETLIKEKGLIRLTSHQVASRLSFFLWGGPPDDQLLDAADANQLTTPEQIQGQVTRLLGDKTHAADSIADFHRQWLKLTIPGGIDEMQKSATTFPQYNDSVRLAIKAGFEAFAASVFLDPDSDHTLKQLLTSPVAFMNEKSAPLFGVKDVKGTDLVMRSLDPTQRAGIFTTPAYIAVHSTASTSHPTKRGVIVWRDLLCGPIGQMPANVPTVQDAPNLSTRQRFEEHDKNPCAVCHKFMDPLGFAFENYDALGQYRTKDGTFDVDATGSETLPSGKTITFKNAVDLMQQLTDTDDVQSCLSKQWYRYALGRMDTDADATSIDIGRNAVKTRSGDLRELLKAVVTSKTFLYRTPEQGEL